MKNIAVMGHIDHGKTTLISTISRIFEGDKKEIFKNSETVLRTETEIEFGGDTYLFFDYEEDSGYEENLNGTEDGAILVVSATDGPLMGTERAVELCEELGIEIAAVFINSCEWVDDEELIELMEMDVQDLLSEHGMEDIPFIRGSARLAGMGYSGWEEGIGKLVDAVAAHF